MNTIRKITIRFGLLLLSICRGAYCCIFFFFTLYWIFVVSAAFLRMVRAHSFDVAGIFAWTYYGAYFIVFAFAWWTIFRDQSASKRWAITASLIITIPPVPDLMIYCARSHGWQDFVKSERDSWPQTLFGIIGIIIFCLPYHEWRNKSHNPTQANTGNALSAPQS